MWQLTIDDIAGICHGEATLRPGINAVQASNWQGKTSFVSAIQAAMGTKTPLRDGVDAGRVELTTDERSVVVEFERRGGDVVPTGDPYLVSDRDRTIAELFAFLDATNPIRRAVRDGADLTPHLTRPLDLEDIDERIADLRAERRRVEAELEDAEEAASQVPAARERVDRLEGELDELRSELAELAGDAPDDDGGGSTRDELAETRTRRRRAEREVEKLDREVGRLEEQLADRRESLSGIDVPGEEGLDDELADARDALDAAREELESLRDLYDANRRIVDAGHVDLVTSVDRRIEADQVECWVCGADTTPGMIEDRLEAMADEITARREEVSEREGRVDALEERIESREAKRREREELRREVEELERRLDDRREALDEARTRLERLTEEVSVLEGEVAETDDRRSDLEAEIARTEAELEDAREQLTDHERRAQGREDLRSSLDTIDAEIETLRSRREDTIDAAREAFDAAIADVIELFDPGFGGARLDKHTDPDSGETDHIELVLARDGREIGVDALSEGEVELVGLMVALAGFEAFNAAERVPIILIDEVGGLAGEHLRTLVEYVRDRAEFVVTTAYPEQGEFDGHTLSPDDWEVVSGRIPSA